MFKSIFNAITICLQGTPLALKPRKGILEKTQTSWTYSVDGHAENPPYVLVADEFKVRNDLISKLHCLDNRLSDERHASKRGRAKWMPDLHEQVYYGENPCAADGQVEIYYRSLGLGMTRESTTLGRSH